jgi:hypothetical protein
VKNEEAEGIDLNELKMFFMSKDLQMYEKRKDKFFKNQSNFIKIE